MNIVHMEALPEARQKASGSLHMSEGQAEA
jgi:hypothetical protein